MQTFSFLKNPWALPHLIFIFTRMIIFLISFAEGIIYLVSEYRIKNKRIGGWFDKLPSLETIERNHNKLLNIGFVFFTLGIITGGGWSKSATGYYVSNNFQQIGSFVLWIFFAIFLKLRVSRGWVGHRGILLSCIGFVAVIILLTWAQQH